jgi:long-chain fatty acid transport protein
MSRCVRRSLGVFATLLTMAMPWALGSGFHLYEQGAKASGQALSFVARADDASAGYYNPAAMVWLEGTQVSVGSSLVFLGDTTFDSEMNLTGSPAFTGGLFEMESNTVAVPHAYYSTGAGNGRIAYGVAVFAPFGLVTEWGPGFDGRYSARTSDLETYVINPNIAFKVSDHWAIAAGVDLLDAELKSFSRNIPPGEIPVDSLFNLKGDGDEIGWNVALSFRNDDWAFGLTYRSGFEVELTGEAIVSAPLAPPRDEFAPMAPTQRLVQRAGGTLDLPETWALGLAYLGFENWEVEFDVHRIGWSSFDRLPINFEYGLEVAPGVLVQQLVQVEDWEDTTSFRLGAARTMGERSELRLGIYWEDSAIPTRTLRPSIPDSDRVGLTLGWGYELAEGFSIDAYWLHIETSTVSTSLEEFIADNSVPAGTYESSIDLIGITANFKL